MLGAQSRALNVSQTVQSLTGQPRPQYARLHLEPILRKMVPLTGGSTHGAPRQGTTLLSEYSQMLTIRPAVPNDAALLKTLIHELAEFECDHASITEEALARDGFGPRPKFRTLIAEWNSQPAGYALFFGYYSSFRGPGLFLEDLYVRSAFRGKSIGRALFAQIASMACKDDCFGVMFNVLEWNQSAIDFYKKLHATFCDEWKTACLEGNALHAIAKEAEQIGSHLA
jgi:GNAT superfamily N-acetyltransferase